MAWARPPRTARGGRRRRSRCHDLHGAGERHRDDAWPRVAYRGALRVAGDQKPRGQMVTRGPPADCPPPPLFVGNPVENNLGEIWSQFAFLMPGLLGDRRGFARRFRTPIEKNGDNARRLLLARRLKPFLLRRTKGEVEADLPAKTEIVRRVVLEGDQRDLYETIRLTMHERVRREIAAHSLERSQIVVLDALLKLRQVCCDPRLVKLAALRKALSRSRDEAKSPAAPAVTSSKLAALMQMLHELAREGRRVLVFSQFTS